MKPTVIMIRIVFLLTVICLTVMPSCQSRNNEESDSSVKKTFQIRGIVVDKNGKPIEGAEIRLLEYTMEGCLLQTIRESEKKVISRDDGTFSFDEVEKRPYEIEVSKQGYIDRHGYVTLPCPELKYVLTAEARIKGKMIDGTTKAPITYLGFEIRWLSDDPDGLGYDGIRSSSFDSEDGTFDMGELRAGDVSIAFSPRGYEPQTISNLELKEGETIDFGVIEFGEGTQLTIKIIDEINGSPIEGARIAFVERTSDEWWATGLEKKTDKEGKYIYRNIEKGKHTIRVVYANYNKSIRAIEIFDKIEEFTLPISTGVTVEGKVLSKEHGLPIQNAEVKLEFTGSSLHERMPTPTVFSQEDGSFKFENMALGKYLLTTTRESYAGNKKEIDVLKDGQSVRTLLSTGGSISINVKDQNRKPIAESEIWVSDAGLSIHEYGTTDENGFCKFEDLPERTYEVTVYRYKSAPGVAIGSNQHFKRNINVRTNQNTDLRFDFPSGYKVYGTVTSNGKPDYSASIWVNSIKSQGLSESKPYSLVLCSTDENGRYMTKSVALPPGKYNMRAYSRYFRDSEYEEREIEITDQDLQVDFADISSTLGSVSGKVTTTDGRPLSGVEILIAEAGKSERMFSEDLGHLISSADTDEHGNYTALNVGRRTFDVRAVKKGYGQSYITLSKDKAEKYGDADFALDESSTITGRISTDDGLQLEHVNITVMNESGRKIIVRDSILENENLVFEALPRGTFEIIVAAKGYGTAGRKVEIDSARIENFDLTLAKGHNLTVTVRDKEGNPISNTEISIGYYDKYSTAFWLNRFECPHGKNTISDGDGVITLRNLNSDSYTFKISKDGFAPKDLSVIIDHEDATAEVVLQEK